MTIEVKYNKETAGGPPKLPALYRWKGSYSGSRQALLDSEYLIVLFNDDYSGIVVQSGLSSDQWYVGQYYSDFVHRSSGHWELCPKNYIVNFSN